MDQRIKFFNPNPFIYHGYGADQDQNPVHLHVYLMRYQNGLDLEGACIIILSGGTLPLAGLR